MKLGLPRLEQIPDGPFRGDARMTRWTGAEVIVDVPPIGLGQFAVDVWGDERVDPLTAKH